MSSITNFLMVIPRVFAKFLENIAMVISPDYLEIKKMSESLSSEDKDILKDLADIHAANLTQFEVKTNRIGSNVGKQLEDLVTRGLVISQEYEHKNKHKETTKIYYPSPKAYKVLVSSWFRVGARSTSTRKPNHHLDYPPTLVTHKPEEPVLPEK